MVEPEAHRPPAPGSHDRSVPTGNLEVSAATLFEAMSEARDAEGGQDREPLSRFYRTLMSSTLLLPIPPEAREDARSALEQAVHEADEIEIGVMLARDPDGDTVSVLFASPGALAAWAPTGSGSLPLPARIVFSNLAASGLPAMLDPAGPIPYRFEADEIAELAAGRLPHSGAPLFAPTSRGSIRVRLPGPEADVVERAAAAALADSGVEAAYLVEAESDDRSRLLLGLVGEPAPGWRLRLPGGQPQLDVVVLEEPLLANVRAVADPLFRRGGR
jgi:hypothetical protein